MTENTLKHIGIILDGNRRFAKRLMMKPWEGHELGFKKLESLLDWLLETNVKELTLYCFSLQNFNRPKIELDFLFKIFKKQFPKFLEDKKIHENKVKLRFIGKRELFDEEIQQGIEKLEKATQNYDNYIINFALGYGGRQNIGEAAKGKGC